jgi:signal transduction histidine kinase
LLSGDAALPEAARRRAARIIAAVDRITELGASLLLLAREARPQLREPVRLRAALAGLWENLAAAAPDRPPCVLEVPETVCVEADPGLLRLVLRNLLENALRHGRGPIVCRLEGRCLTVRDHGAGLGEGDPERLFARFYRQGPGAGHGLGLALVRHVCTACGWTVRAGNAPGGGAVFTVDFAQSLSDAGGGAR